MSIFNSLGSNYNLEYVLKSLFIDNNDASNKLKNLLEKKYQGKATLTYKGRGALTLALKILNLPKESVVAINGFTCFAVYKAIEKASYSVECLDLQNKDLNFSSETLINALRDNSKIKVVVIQNTLGYPCDIEKIEKICKEKKLILIEDLAHCVGTKYSDDREAGSPRSRLAAKRVAGEAGSVGDFVTLSFSQDKMIDAVSGGALVIRNKKFQNSILASQGEALELLELKTLNFLQQLKDRFYPLLTYKIRFLYDLSLGKPLHFILKNLNLLSKLMNESLYTLYSLPNWYCSLALTEFAKLNPQLNHRRKIAQIYADNLDKKILSESLMKNIYLSSNLRFPVFLENRKSLINYLKKDNIHVADIWYDDVAPECPNAVNVSHTILNLPTHINVSEKDALRITEKINIWLKSQ
ncbi:MAG: DegT/DnrJ/EryC1/StrS aminotransferase family protein [Candidatus Levybacteria bacterium]|nr:DegT/DnrJ/EryC1/StrS aminotransferase family protein [Candidatus Levybacteria bacterium]